MTKNSSLNNLTIKNLRTSFQEQTANFNAAIENVMVTQRDKLLTTLFTNQNTHFGKTHAFSRIKSIAEFRQHIPIHEYRDYLPYIERIKAGEPAILTQESVVCLEPTSGSTDFCKLIPYTQSLYRDFQNGIAPWLYYLYENEPIAAGRFYWSITPALTMKANNTNTIPIGTSNDFAYFTDYQQQLFMPLSAVPFSINNLTDIDEFKINTLMHLLMADDLSFISIWNPSYLTLLLEYFISHADEIISLLPASYRRNELIHSWKHLKAQPKHFFLTTWPRLALISCWADAYAKYYATQLQQYLPEIPIQGKGLISTEAFISFPYRQLPGNILSITSHFFEFKPLGCDDTSLAHELTIGEKYEVIVTTNGGFYRYNTHDIVEIIGYHQQAPLLKFLGRNHVIDHVGEKINELQLSTLLQQFQKQFLKQTSFLLCAPERDNQNTLFYAVFLATQDDESNLNEFAEQLEINLLHNFHYRYARQLGQLDKIRIYKIHDPHPHEIYLTKHLHQGKQLGQIKPAYIDKNIGWTSVFKGEWL